MVAGPNLELLWAKSNAAGSPHSLPGHLLDTVAVAELIWDDFMAPGFQAKVDACCGGLGRDLFRLICGLHDVGKASPSFESKDLKLAADLARELGPGSLGGLSAVARTWHHTHAGRAILEDYLPDNSTWSWIPVLIEGHHGVLADFPAGVRFDGRGGDAWIALQRRLCAWVEDRVGLRLADLEGVTPSRAVQLALAGFVVMADWIASCDRLPGLGTQPADLSHARARARKAWDAFGLRGGWALTGETVPFVDRFGFEPRPLQRAVMEAAETMERPGLMLVEAPMGEGKTEAALAAVEILVRRFGCDGFVFAMPTQGTTDAMYARCEEWAHRVDPTFPLALVHGKAMLNDPWSKRLDAAQALPDIVGVWDPYGVADPYSAATEDTSPRRPAALLRASGIPSSWLLARHRALLSPGVVMTVDHLLYAGTNTKFVMLRHAGLSGKVVVIDEVHSYDIFMESFLDVVLRWLGEAGVPVILMSATLPPDQRKRLLDAYNGPSPKQPRPWAVAPVAPPAPWAPASYPVVACRERGGPVVSGDALSSWRPALSVAVEVLGDASVSVDRVAERIHHDMVDGGCALAIMNTVGRAQALAHALREAGLPILLIHGRLTTGERADRTARAVDLLGKDKTRASGRPECLVVVATQIAEQSFDVDVDVLYTDLAPMDLLLQRIGRLHRHLRPLDDRPPRFRSPRVVVTGVCVGAETCSYPAAFGRWVYDDWTLLRTAGALCGAPVWQIPTDVPYLVAEAYAETCAWMPAGWKAREDQARAERARTERSRASRAESFGLGAGATDRSNLAGLQQMLVEARGENAESIVVRDGEPTLEVSLVVRRGDEFTTLDGRPLGPTGEAATSRQVALEVLRDSVRLRDLPCFRGLVPLPGWGLGLLRTQPALILDAQLRSEPDGALAYDPDDGLAIDWRRMPR